MSPPHDRRRMKGVGRVAFIAHLAEITAELDAGWPIKAVYEKRKERLGSPTPSSPGTSIRS